MRTNFTLKQLGITLLLFLLGKTLLNAQSPEAFNYQGVARNASGGALVSQQINVRIAIVNGNTIEEYIETHLVTTSSTGIFSLKVGTGTVLAGDFTTIDWTEGGNKFIKTSIDENGGTSFKELGSVQLLSVPYALHATTADSSKASTPQNLSLSGNELSIEGGNSVTLPSGGSSTNTGNPFILITGDITDAEAQAQVDAELGSSTAFIYIMNTSQLTTLDLSVLKSAVQISVVENEKLVNLDISGVESIGEELFVRYNKKLSGLSCPLLKMTGDDVHIEDNDEFSTLSLPSLTATRSVTVRQSPVFTLDLSALKYVSASLSISQTNITSLDIRNLKSLGYLSVNGNTQLTSLQIPSNINYDGFSTSFFENALTTASVNDILASLVTWSFEQSTNVSLSQISSTPPTGQGLVDKQTLIDAGNSVTTD